MTWSHTNKATFSSLFLHPPSPSTAMNVMPPMRDHMREARGHQRKHTVGVQGTLAIFCFILYFTQFHSISLNFTQFNISPSSTQPLNMSKMCCLCLPSLTDTPPSLPTTAIPSPTCWTSKTCPPCTEYWRHTPCGMFWCPEHNLPPLSLISNTRICTMRVCSGCLGLLSPFPSCWTPKTTLWVVMSRGNPWVQQAIPLPLPLKTPTPHQG